MNKNTREKGFSLGFFDENYVRSTDVAVIKDETGQIRAFANLWQTAGREELSIDLMRYDPDSPRWHYGFSVCRTDAVGTSRKLPMVFIRHGALGRIGTPAFGALVA